MADDNDADDKGKGKDSDEEVLATAKARFDRCVEHYSQAREKARGDIRFAAASPDDPYQWDDRQFKERTNQQRPSLTINKLPQHIRQVTNDVRMNRPSIRFRPADNKADPEVAEILMGCVRHIEAISDADIAYDTATEHQVTHGEGFIRVMADYTTESSFDQDIYIKRVKNPFSVFLDPDIQDPTGADARFAFVEERLDETEFKAQYPDEDPIDWSTQNQDETGWFTNDKKVRVCEYFEVVEKAATLILWRNGAVSYKDDPLPKGVTKGERPAKTRKSTHRAVIWRKMTGASIIEKKEFPSRYIPIARVVGNEWEVEGELLTSGIVRNAKDSQRMYNVAQSAITERTLQAPKAPWAAPAAAIEGYEEIWKTANTANHAFLPYNHVSEDGQPIPAPQRISPAVVEAGLTEVARSASDDIQAETGQYDASLGQRSNETSGRAILARQREGDTSTFHFVDNLARAVRHVGRIILDMYPKVYDARRVALIIGEDATSTSAILDPEQDMPVQKQSNAMGQIERTFNPYIGQYDVYATTGPSFTTRRVEAAQAMSELVQASPQLWGVVGDQLVKNMDWPGAEEMSKRLRVTLIPPVQQMLASEESGQDALPPEVQAQMQQMQQQMQQMGQALQEAQAKANDVQQRAMESQMKFQADMARVEVDKTKLGLEQQSIQATLAESASKPQMEQMRLENERLIQAQKDQAETERNAWDNATKVLVAEIAAKSTALAAQPPDVDPMGMGAEPAEPAIDPQANIATALAQLASVMEQMRAPRQIVRDENGRIQGIQ
jgi:hypothetical protein